MPTFVGTSGDDAIAGTAGPDQIYGRAGNDTLSGGDGNDGIFGEDGDDIIDAGTGFNTLVGGAGSDVLTVGGTDGNYLYSDSRAGTAFGDDYLDTDRLTGGAGNDLFYVGYNDIVDGGGGSNFIALSLQGALSGVTLDLRPIGTGGTVINGTGTLRGFENFAVDGSRFNDILTGFSNNLIAGQYLDGRQGNDSLTGGDGADTLYGGSGIDVLRGGAGADLLYSGVRDLGNGGPPIDDGTEVDTLYGEDGDDRLTIGVGDIADGGTGFDILSIDLSFATAGVVLDMAQLSTAAGQIVFGGRLSNFEAFGFVALPNFANTLIMGDAAFEPYSSIYGGFANDTISASNRDDTIDGRGGNDVIDGRGGDDLLRGENGDDVLEGGTGRNTLYGGAGFDIASYASATSRVNVNLGVQYQYSLGAGSDYYDSIEGIRGSAFDDVIRGGFFDDVLYGMDGNDLILGMNGNDRIEGGAGANVLAGGAGDDTIVVTTAGNELSGGTGNDVFIVVSRIDTIIENAGEGIDEIRTTAPVYVLPNNVEYLTFTDNAAHVAGYGNALDNTLRGGTGYDGLVGDAGNDTIIGGAGAANELIGGTGDDTYVVTASGDTIVEYANEGIDGVSTTLLNYTLRANVENLSYEGSGSFGGVGNSAANIMTGGTGNDTLVGLDGADILIGGLGADLLIGGNGADQFRYYGGETGYDRIIDFVAGSDKIALFEANFSHSPTISLVSGAGAVANSANSTFLYDTSTGIVSFDADGNGAGAAVQLAQLNTGLVLSAGDFIFF